MSNQSLKDRSVSGSTYPIGVIIPTYNRSDSLLLCLKHLEQQTWTDFEVVVVDDGSTDSTPQRVEEYQRQTPLHLRYIRQENSGPARARNAAIAALQSPICLMIGDDIFASPSFVATHLQLHQQKPDLRVAALGLTRWSDSGQTVTKFMRWLDESGIQFAYNDLTRGARPDWKYFYTSNLSLKTTLLLENPFNELFTKAAVEDIELGYRLEQRCGLNLIFIPMALANHLHPTGVQQACRRMFNVGVAFYQFHQIWPDTKRPSEGSRIRQALRNFWLNHWSLEWLFAPIISALLTPLIALADILTRIWCPNPIMRCMLRYYFASGYRKAPRLKKINQSNDYNASELSKHNFA